MIYIKLTLSIFVLLFSLIGPYNSYLNYIPFNSSHYLNVVKGESIDVTISKISDLNFINKLFLRIYLNHNGIYQFPLQGGKNRFHPTQKSLLLFEELIKKHSNENDIVLDTFLGSGTTAIASKNTNRIYKGCEISKEYYDKILKLLE